MSEIGYKKITEIKQYKTKITLIQIKEIIAMKKKKWEKEYKWEIRKR